MCELFSAIKDNNIEEIKRLLDNEPAKVNKPDSSGRIPIQHSIEYSNKATIKLLLEYKADIHRTDNDNRVLLIIAAFKRDLEIVKFLVENGFEYQINKVNNNGRTPIFHAVLSKNFDVVKFFLNYIDDINKADTDKGNTILHHAIERDFFKIVEPLLNSKAKVNIKNKDGCLPIHYAAGSGDFSIFRIIYNYGKPEYIRKSNNFEDYPIHYAAKAGSENIVEFLINNGSRNFINYPNADGQTPIIIAVLYNHLNLIKYFKKLGIDISKVENNSFTILDLACSNKNIDITIIHYLVDENSILNHYYSNDVIIDTMELRLEIKEFIKLFNSAPKLLNNTNAIDIKEQKLITRIAKDRSFDHITITGLEYLLSDKVKDKNLKELAKNCENYLRECLNERYKKFKKTNDNLTDKILNIKELSSFCKNNMNWEERIKVIKRSITQFSMSNDDKNFANACKTAFEYKEKDEQVEFLLIAYDKFFSHVNRDTVIVRRYIEKTIDIFKSHEVPVLNDFIEKYSLIMKDVNVRIC